MSKDEIMANMLYYGDHAKALLHDYKQLVPTIFLDTPFGIHILPVVGAPGGDQIALLPIIQRVLHAYGCSKFYLILEFLPDRDDLSKRSVGSIYVDASGLVRLIQYQFKIVSLQGKDEVIFTEPEEISRNDIAGTVLQFFSLLDPCDMSEDDKDNVRKMFPIVGYDDLLGSNSIVN